MKGNDEMKKITEETIKAVKGFKLDMTCTPTEDIKFQYEEGKTYEEETADACHKGFHACELPIDVFRYYPPTKSIYHEVDMFGEIDDSNIDKVCSSKIKIGAKINIAGIIKASVDIIRGKAEKESAASSGDCGNAASSGNCGSAKANHPNSCAIAWGPESKASGVIGSHLVLAEWGSNGGNCWDEKTWIFRGAKWLQLTVKTLRKTLGMD